MNQPWRAPSPVSSCSWVSRYQCLSMEVGSPGLTNGIAAMVQEVEHTKRLFRITYTTCFNPCGLVRPLSIAG